MLMVNHVVLKALGYLAKVVDLKNEYTIFPQQVLNTSRDAANVRDVRVDIIGYNQIRWAVTSANVAGDLFGKEVVDKRDSRVVDAIHDVGRRVDADKRAYVLVGKRSQ